MEETQVSPVAETQNPAPVSAATPEVATPETTEQQTQHEAEPDPREKAVKSLERRVGRLTAAKYQTAAERDQLAAELEQARQRLSQYEQPQQEALTPEKVLPIAQQLAQEIRETEKVRETVTSVLNAGKAIEGFDAACNAVNEAVPFYDKSGKPTPFLRAVLEGSAPEKVLHYLGTNADVADELAGMTPTQVARRLERIEIELSKPAEPKASTAPKAIAPVKTATRDDGGLSDGLTTAEWIKRRNKQALG